MSLGCGFHQLMNIAPIGDGRCQGVLQSSFSELSHTQTNIMPALYPLPMTAIQFCPAERQMEFCGPIITKTPAPGFAVGAKSSEMRLPKQLRGLLSAIFFSLSHVSISPEKQGELGKANFSGTCLKEYLLFCYDHVDPAQKRISIKHVPPNAVTRHVSLIHITPVCASARTYLHMYRHYRCYHAVLPDLFCSLHGLLFHSKV